MFYSLLFKGLF